MPRRRTEIDRSQLSMYIPRNYGRPDYVHTEPFHDSVLSANIDNMAKLLDSDPNLLEKQYYLSVPSDSGYGNRQIRGGTPLFLALQQASASSGSSESIEVVNFLLDKGANLHGYSPEWSCLLLPAFRTIPELFKKIQSIATPSDIITLLAEIVKSRNKILAAELLEGPLSFDVLHQHSKQSIFDIAVEQGDLEMMKLLHSFKVHESFPSSPFVALCKGNVFLHDKLSTAIVELLLEQGFDINNNSSHGIGLMEALRMGKLILAELYLEHGANPDVADTQLHSPLHLVCSMCNLPLIQKILNKSNKTVNLITKDGQLPLINLIEAASSTAGIDLLLEHGADVELACKHGLMYHVMMCQTNSLLEYFLNRGAKLHYVAPGGLTALNGALSGFQLNAKLLNMIFTHGEETLAVLPQEARTKKRTAEILDYYTMWPKISLVWLSHLKGDGEYFNLLPKPILYDIIFCVTGHKLKLYK